MFSFSTPEVDGGRGNEGMLVEEYGERASEARRPGDHATPSRSTYPVQGPGAVMKPEASLDEIAEPPDSTT